MSLIYFLAYLAIAVAGAAAVVDPPEGIIIGIGQGMLLVWAFMLIAGGLIGGFATLPGIWWLERGGTLSCMTGILVYGAIICTLPITQMSQRVISMCFIFFALAMFSARLFRIRRYAYDPEK